MSSISSLNVSRLLGAVSHTSVVKFALAIAIAFVAGAANQAKAQDYIGIVPELLKPEVASELGLSDQQKQAVNDIIRKRRSAALGLAAQLREATSSQKPELMNAFRDQSEQMVVEILDAGQKARFAQLRVRLRGLVAVGSGELAKSLNLADWQIEEITKQRDIVESAKRTSQAERTRGAAEREIRKVLSESQFAAWQVAAGELKETSLGAPQPPERKQEPAPAPAAIAQAKPQMPVDVAKTPIDQVRLQISFNGEPWSEVINWFAEQADLSVQSDVIPPGSFTYRDRSRTFSVTETLDIMNATLLQQGYTFFRQGRMLRCINFEQDQNMAGEVLVELADFVDAAELATRGKYEPVQTVFSLDRLNPEDIEEEVAQLLSIQGTVISLPAAGQIRVTDTAGNVRLVAEFLKRAEDPNSARAKSIQTFPLENINAEEVLSVARPLIGLEEGVNVSDSIKLSTDTFGTTIYAMGNADVIQNLKDLVKAMDVPPAESEAVIEYKTPYIDRHRVSGIELQLAFEVISQLLAGAPDVRLAQDESAKQLVLLGREAEHKLVNETLAKLAGESSDFEVIQLDKLDTQLAIAAIKKFFSLPDSTDGESGGPVIDGDLLARQVWVKGSASEVEKIKELLNTLESNASSSDPFGEKIRMIPLTGRAADDALSQMEVLWQQTYGGSNRLRVMNLDRSSGSGLQQRTFGDDKRAERPSRRRAMETEAKSETQTELNDKVSLGEGIPRGFLAATQDGSDAGNDAEAAVNFPGSDIVIMRGPNGLIVSSDDKEALDKFENLMRTISDQAMIGSSDPTVVYLQHIKATAAKELLESTLSGSSSSGGGGGLLGDMATSVLGGFGGGLMGAMMGGGGDDLLGSTAGMASGDYSIVADPRLNALIIKASPADMRLIEQLLEVFDQVESPFAIETQGQVELIPVITQDVTEVLNTIKGLYGDRIEGAGSSGGGGGGGRGGQPNPAEFIAALRGGRGGRGGASGGTSELTEPKISLGADVNTNMLIVMAQPKQIEDIKYLVNLLDKAGESVEEEVAVIQMPGIKTEVLKDSVQRLLGPKAITNSTGSSSSGSSSPSSSSGGSTATDAAAQARRAEFFQRLRDSGAFSRGGRGGGTTGGASPFGGRGGGTTGRGGAPTGGRGGAAGGGRPPGR